MRSAHTDEQVREAERSLMARLPAGALMQRAAAGLAYAVIDLLGRAYGARVLLLVGSGDNDGDAAPPDVVVDGIVGIGGRPGLRDEAAAAVSAVDGVPVVAVDVPSGVDEVGDLVGAEGDRDGGTGLRGRAPRGHRARPAGAARGRAAGAGRP